MSSQPSTSIPDAKYDHEGPNGQTDSTPKQYHRGSGVGTSPLDEEGPILKGCDDFLYGAVRYIYHSSA